MFYISLEDIAAKKKGLVRYLGLRCVACEYSRHLGLRCVACEYSRHLGLRCVDINVRMVYGVRGI